MNKHRIVRRWRLQGIKNDLRAMQAELLSQGGVAHAYFGADCELEWFCRSLIADRQ